jgi:hypothetical protein
MMRVQGQRQPILPKNRRNNKVSSIDDLYLKGYHRLNRRECDESAVGIAERGHTVQAPG